VNWRVKTGDPSSIDDSERRFGDGRGGRGLGAFDASWADSSMRQ
jgi:hypothetical protein